MTAVRKREAEAIATLVAIAEGDWSDVDHHAARSAAVIAAEWLRRAGLRDRPMRAPVARRQLAAWSTEADYREARTVVLERAKGQCEVNADGCFGWANNVHHRAGRGFEGCHHPDLLVAVCGMGNISGCHAKLHQSDPEVEPWTLPWGTRADGVQR